jgi:hypothetical protein
MRNSLLFLVSITASLGAALSAPKSLAQPASQSGKVNVSTYRSDGAVFSSVVQVSRKQKARRILVTGSRQALPVQQGWIVLSEPPSGGVHVAPANGRTEEEPRIGTVIVVEPRLLSARRQQNNNKSIVISP